jgi:hypothetical protein
MHFMDQLPMSSTTVPAAATGLPSTAFNHFLVDHGAEAAAILRALSYYTFWMVNGTVDIEASLSIDEAHRLDAWMRVHAASLSGTNLADRGAVANAGAVHPVAISVSTKVWIKLPFARGPL